VVAAGRSARRAHLRAAGGPHDLCRASRGHAPARGARSGAL